MQREIKFRVWDHDLKKFIEDSNADPHICWNGTVYCHERQKEGGDVLVSGIRNITVQQYTGMKDKNGKEIYEGDIVEGLYKDTDYNHWDEIKASVVYSDRFAGFSIGCENWVKQSIEVIGNIFENPELLK